MDVKGVGFAFEASMGIGQGQGLKGLDGPNRAPEGHGPCKSHHGKGNQKGGGADKILKAVAKLLQAVAGGAGGEGGGKGCGCSGGQLGGAPGLAGGGIGRANPFLG
ncbi:MAG: hypothetical protein AB7S38_23540 [Vulcanimicrobiota bacterium]